MHLPNPLVTRSNVVIKFRFNIFSHSFCILHKNALKFAKSSWDFEEALKRGVANHIRDEEFQIYLDFWIFQIKMNTEILRWIMDTET